MSRTFSPAVSSTIRLDILRSIRNYSRRSKEWARTIANANPKWLGLSMLTYQCDRFAKDFLSHVRSVAPDVNIVIGGGFVDEMKKFREEYFNLGLIDAIALVFDIAAS